MPSLKCCEENLITYIDNTNIDDTCLGKLKLHPNKKGKTYSAKNLINFIESAKRVNPPQQPKTLEITSYGITNVPFNDISIKH